MATVQPMQYRPLVSAVIATYNMARYLLEAIRSVLAQTYQNLEIIIVDDGSTDNTLEVVTPFLSDPRVRYFRQHNQGQASAKNHGVQVSSGELVAFLDADDMWVPEKLELQVPLFSRSDALGVVYARLQCIDENGNILRDRSDARYMLYRGQVTAKMFLANFVRFGTSVVRRECFEQLGAFDPTITMGVDYDLWLRFSTRYDFDYVDRPLLYYRIWPGQMSSNCIARYESGLRIMARFLERYPNAIDRKARNIAWAHTYSGLGFCLLSTDRRILPAIGFYFRALRYKPNYLPTWRLLAEAAFGIRREWGP